MYAAAVEDYFLDTGRNRPLVARLADLDGRDLSAPFLVCPLRRSSSDEASASVAPLRRHDLCIDMRARAGRR